MPHTLPISFSIVGITAALLLAASTTPVVAQSACGELVAAFHSTLSARNLDASITAGQRVLSENSCQANTRSEVGRLMALAHARAASRIPNTPATAADRLKLLEAGSEFGKPWQLMAMIGDLRQQVKSPTGEVDYKGASTAYQDALAEIADSSATPKPPPPAEIKRLINLAQQTRMLASNFVPGENLTRGGILLRDIVVEAVLPIQFEFDSDEMTKLGKEYADELWTVLETEKPRILLIGHTDPKGADQYNLDLSLRRAQAVKRYLTQRGYPAAAIAVDGRGRREPLHIEEADQYTEQQIHQILRRVELKYR